MAEFEFGDVIAHAKRIAGAHQSIASDVYPNGARLVCQCGYTSEHSVEETARFFATSWPKHCRLTMVAEAK